MLNVAWPVFDHIGETEPGHGETWWISTWEHWQEWAVTSLHTCLVCGKNSASVIPSNHFKIYYLMKQYICTSSCWRCSQDCLRERKLMLLPLPCILVEKQRWYWRGSIVSSCQLSLLHASSLVRLTVLVGRFRGGFSSSLRFYPYCIFCSCILWRVHTNIGSIFSTRVVVWERAIYGRERGQM